MALTPKKRIGIILISAVLLVLIVLIGMGFIQLKIPGFVSKEDVAQKVKSLYELANPGAVIEVVTTTEESGIYKIILKVSDISGTTYRESYVTKDGKLLTESVIFVKESIEQIEKMKNFVDCLDNKTIRIYGISNQTATLLQLNILGRYSTKLFVACDGDLVQRCIAANVTQVPSVVFGNYVDPGVKTIDWFEKISGCKF